MPRRPKPTAIKKASGNPGKRKINDAEPATEGVPVMPPHMTDRAKEAWVYVLPILTSRGLAGDLDAWAIERMCEVYAEIVELMKIVGDGGHTYECETEGGGSMVRPRPEVGMLSDADRRFRAYLVEFGLTPASRSKVAISEKKQQDPRARFFGPRAAG